MITDPTLMGAVLAYCTAHRQPCYAIHTPPGSTIGGFSCELVNIIGDTAGIRIANGDRRRVPVAEIHLRSSADDL